MGKRHNLHSSLVENQTIDYIIRIILKISGRLFNCVSYLNNGDYILVVTKSKIYKHLFFDDISTINKEIFFRLNNMTYNEKKSLYESIMKDVAKIVKRRLNESDLISREDASDIAD